MFSQFHAEIVVVKALQKSLPKFASIGGRMCAHSTHRL
jgi:hypothetical protein